MTILKNILIVVVCIVLSGIVAFSIAAGLANTGMLGSCFEGACGYAAMFFAFPLLWLVLSAVSVVVVFASLRRR